MFRNLLSKPYDKNPRGSDKFINDEPNINERKLAVGGLIISLGLICCKLYCSNSITHIHPKTVTTFGENIWNHFWQTAIGLNKLWLSAGCGIFVTYFTWMFVYLDSNVPGISPPSPLSPQKFRSQSGHSFHINYAFAVIVGVAVAAYMCMHI